MKGFEDFLIIKMLIVNVFFFKKNKTCSSYLKCTGSWNLFHVYIWLNECFCMLQQEEWNHGSGLGNGNVRFVPDIKMQTNCVFLFCFMLFLFYTFAPFGLLSELNCISTYQKCMYFKVIVKAECSLFPCSVWIYEQKRNPLFYD